MSKLKVGVIGLGHLGRFHAEKLAQIPMVDLVGICDVNPERLTEVGELLAKKYNLKPLWTTNYEAIFPIASAVVIATPTINHYEIAKRAIQAGKATLVEKPLTDDLEQALELIELAEKNGIVLQVGYVERFQKVTEVLRERVRNPIYIEAHRIGSFTERNLDIDVILDLMVHDLDLLFLFKKKEDLDFLHAVGAPVFTERPDIVNARLVFKDGTTCNLSASRISLSKQRKFRVFIPGAYFRLDTVEKTLVQVLVDPTRREYKIDKVSFPEDDPLLAELKAFVEAVLGLRKPTSTAKETMPSLEVALLIKGEVDKNLRFFK